MSASTAAPMLVAQLLGAALLHTVLLALLMVRVDVHTVAAVPVSFAVGDAELTLPPSPATRLHVPGCEPVLVHAGPHHIIVVIDPAERQNAIRNEIAN